MPSVKPPTPVILPWFTSQKDWARVRANVIDPEHLGPNYNKWLAKFKEMETQLQGAGHQVTRIPIVPDEFFAFCKDRRIPVDGVARQHFVLFKAGVDPEDALVGLVDEVPRRRVGVAWFKEEQWERLRAIAPAEFTESYDKWCSDSMDVWKELAAKGAEVLKIEVDLDELAAWCERDDYTMDVAALKAFIAEKLRLTSEDVV